MKASATDTLGLAARDGRIEAEIAESTVGVGGREPQSIALAEHRQVDVTRSRDGPAEFGVRIVDDARSNSDEVVAAQLVQRTGELSRTPGAGILQVADDVRHGLTGIDEGRKGHRTRPAK